MENFWDQTKVDDDLMRLYISHPGESKPQMWDFPMRRGPIW